MLSTSERKKNRFARSLLPSFNAEMKKYDEVYQLYCESGYTKELCDLFGDYFVNDVKKPAADDIILLASLYDKIHDNKSADFYLDMLSDKKLSSEDRYNYCIGVLNTSSKLKRWRDAEDFRTGNINFIQTYMQKKTMPQQADMYMALALADCAAKHYSDAFRILNFGYKPQGKNDEKLLEILTTAVYIYACDGDEENVAAAVENAKSCLKLFSHFEFGWCKEYFEKRIDDAASGII